MIVIENNKKLNNAYIEKLDPVDYVTITNSGTKNVDAYLYIEYDGTLETKGLSISTTYSGTYTGLDDSVFIGNINDSYRISKANFNNTKIDGQGGIVLSNAALDTGTYTSKIISISDMNLAGNFIAEYSTSSGTDISFYYRCSNKAPIPVEELWWKDSEKVDIYDNTTTTFSSWSITPYSMCFDSLRGRVVVSLNNYLKSYNITNGSLIGTSSSSNDWEFDHRMRMDVFGCVWGYTGSSISRIQANRFSVEMSLIFYMILRPLLT